MKTHFVSFVLIFGLLIAQAAIAQMQTTGTWENYVGFTQWRVTVTEDQTGCGAERPTAVQLTASIEHNKNTAEIGDLGHGKTSGVFVGNTLRIRSKEIPDGIGKSILDQYDVTFTPDCSWFFATYKWYYSDAYQQCSGDTTWSGTRTDGTGCPTTAQKKAILEARAAAEAEKERRYAEILANDPKNFWANWDMAERRKKQGNYREYLQYFNNAATNENIFKDTREQLNNYAARRLHLSELPTRDKSPILRIEQDELKNWNSGLLYNVNFRKEEVADNKWSFNIWTLFNQNSHKLVNDIVGLPE
ncbi:hypothetical protein HYV79_01105 [Candidatus Woesearchaeota archaeon]|nr:hypothetical protein [Candidatus Woesearchaeota archaeon]